MKKLISLILCACIFLCPLSGTVAYTEDKPLEENTIGHMYLYGEYHGEQSCLDKELEVWGKYYEEGMRDLFVELPCYMAGYLNLWMEKGSKVSLVYGSPDREEDLSFYRAIRDLYPETVFHGTDLGHKLDVGCKYLEHLKAKGLEDSDLYRQTEKAMKDGEYFYSNGDDWDFRENVMVENFIEEYSKLNGKDIMGIYGNGHITTKATGQGSKGPKMLSQLIDYYGEANITATNLS